MPTPLPIFSSRGEAAALIDAQALMAICHDPDTLAEVADLSGKVIAVDVTAAGGVKWHEQDEAGDHLTDVRNPLCGYKARLSQEAESGYRQDSGC
jgi:hypothetical protein